jgi:hypothetical protein
MVKGAPGNLARARSSPSPFAQQDQVRCVRSAARNALNFQAMPLHSQDRNYPFVACMLLHVDCKSLIDLVFLAF